jgi:hypothetical protein
MWAWIHKHPALVSVMIVLFLLTPAAIIGVASSQHKSTAAAAATEALPAVEISDNPADPSSGASLNGHWTADLGSSTLLAVVTDNGIEIQWANGDSSALYWKGTFPVPQKLVAKFTIVSEGDLHAMDESMLGSKDLEKTFTYENNTINFSLTAIGVTTKVHLSR